MGNLCATPASPAHTPPGPPPDPIKPSSPVSSTTTPHNLKVYTLAELKTATNNFRSDAMLGLGREHTFERVFKGWVDEVTYEPSKVGVGIPVTVKISNSDDIRGPREWKAELEFLGKFRHPNMVKLIGYCWEEKQIVLAYEYTPKGSLDNHLFRGGFELLSWEIRIKIATGVASGLTFLHTSKVIYRNFKTSNILLDGNFNPKLSDFGLATLGPSNDNSHVSTDVVGTYGYAAPEYIATGRLNIKSDVYGFGVVLLELLTGLRAVDLNRPSGSDNLVEWAKPSLRSKKKIKKLIDPGFGDDYSPKGAWATAEVILKCLESDPRKRPSMEEVLVILEKISSFKDRPKKPKSRARTSNRY